jgi:protein-S-isoprenylcysteine O-methyltransferase Ste14
LLALVWCPYLKNPLPIAGIVLALAARGFLIATSIAEEQENLMSFGAAYAVYMKRTLFLLAWRKRWAASCTIVYWCKRAFPTLTR